MNRLHPKELNGFVLIIGVKECKACCDPMGGFCNRSTAAHVLEGDDTSHWDGRAFPGCKQQYYPDRGADALWRRMLFLNSVL